MVCIKLVFFKGSVHTVTMLMRMGSTHERFKNKNIAKAAPGGRAAAQNRLCNKRRFSVRIIFA